MSGMSTSQPITLTDHTSSSEDSNESELAPSIRRLQSTASLPTTSNTHIAFAPLPLIEPRKHRSTSHVRLGVSARSSLMRQRRLAVEKGEGSQPREQPRGREEGWGALKKLPLGSETWQDEEYPRTKTRNEHMADSDVVFLAMGRLVKSAWRRVSQTPTRAPSSTPPNGSAGNGDVKLEQELDANKISSEPEEELGGESREESRGQTDTVCGE